MNELTVPMLHSPNVVAKTRDRNNSIKKQGEALGTKYDAQRLVPDCDVHLAVRVEQHIEQADE